MKTLQLITGVIALYMYLPCNCAIQAGPVLDLLQQETIPAVFAGEGRTVRAVFGNSTPTEIDLELRTRLFQMTSTTATPVGDIQPRHRFRVPPGQTVIESVNQTFPDVRAATHFLVQWIDRDNLVLAKTEILVYPPDLLRELKSITPTRPIGLFDPTDTIKTRLTALKIDYTDLERQGWEQFPGKLVIITPFAHNGIDAATIERQAKNGLSIVWIQPPTRLPKLEPATYVLGLGKGVVVVVENRAVADLPTNPISQLNLVRLARLALTPNDLHLPATSLKL